MSMQVEAQLQVMIEMFGLGPVVCTLAGIIERDFHNNLTAARRAELAAVAEKFGLSPAPSFPRRRESIFKKEVA